MPPNENPAPFKGRASRVSFADWTPDGLTLSFYRAQHVIGNLGIRPEVAAMIGAVFLGAMGHG